MYADVTWVLVPSGSQVQPQVILDPDYLPDYLSVCYDYGCTIDFSFVQVLVQDFLLKGLLKVMTSLEDVTRCYLQCTCIKKEKIRFFLTGLLSLI